MNKLSYHTQPGATLTGELQVPGDKSISHRAIMFAAIAEGISEIKGFLQGQDTLATLKAFRDMGVNIEEKSNNLLIHGVGLHGLKAPKSALNLGNSGTSMRLLAGLLVGQHFAATLQGDSSLSKRPMKRIINPLLEMGASIKSTDGHPPLYIEDTQGLRAIHYELPIPSAQVKSCLLLAGLYAKGNTQIVEPVLTRDHTERMLRLFSCDISRKGATIFLPEGQALLASNIFVPGDLSSAAFFIVAASIIPGSDITLKGIGINPTRIGVIDILRLMGADIQVFNQQENAVEPIADIRVKSASLSGINIPEASISLAIDEFPAIFIAAAMAEGVTTLRGAKELRVKESDRLAVMADGLKSLGIDVVLYEDGLSIRGGRFTSGRIHSHGDHRIAMAFSIAGQVAEGSLVIDDCENVATSFPNFVALARQAGFLLEEVS